MRRRKWTNVVRFAVVVPGDDFNEARTEGQNVVPTLIPQQVGREDPVLAVRYLAAEVRGEPRRCRCNLFSVPLHLLYAPGRELTRKIGFALKRADVRVVAISDSDIAASSGCFIVAIVGPCHPVQCAVNDAEVTDSGMEVRHKEDVRARGRAKLGDVEAVPGKGRDEDLVVHLQLGGETRVLFDLGANGAGLAGVPPVKVEGNEDLHAIVGRRLVGEAQLRVSVWIYANIQRKGIDAQRLCTFHIIIVILGTLTIAGNADLWPLSAFHSQSSLPGTTQESAQSYHEMAEDKFLRGISAGRAQSAISCKRNGIDR